MFHRALYIFAMYSELTEKSLVKITMDFPVFSLIQQPLKNLRISCAVRIGYGGPLYILQNPEMIFCSLIIPRITDFKQYLFYLGQM